MNFTPQSPAQPASATAMLYLAQAASLRRPSPRIRRR